MSTVRVLVTGASGQDGSYLVEQLLAEGAEVHALVRPGEEPGAGVHPLPGEVHQHEGDLRDGAALEALVAEVAPTEIYNLGGLSSVALSWQEPALTAQISGLAVGHLLQAAHDLQERSGEPVSFVQASSAEIFARTARVPQDETTPLRPLSPYGAAKAYAHHLVGVYRAQGLRACSCVLYNHESPRRPETFVTRKITAGVARIARGLPGRAGHGQPGRPAGLGLGAGLRAGDGPGRPRRPGAGLRHRHRRLAQRAGLRRGGVPGRRDRRLGAPRHLDQRFVRPNDAPELVGDASRARELLGWEPPVRFADVVARMVRHDLALLDGGPETPLRRATGPVRRAGLRRPRRVGTRGLVVPSRAKRFRVSASVAVWRGSRTYSDRAMTEAQALPLPGNADSRRNGTALRLPVPRPELDIVPPPAAREWPAVSVVMPVLNEQKHLAASVAQILGQEYGGELELVIALGPSKDATDRIARKLAFGDPRIKLVSNPTGRTPAGLNAAVLAASHDIIARVDGHGVLLPGYMEKAVRLLEETGAANVGGLMLAVGETPFEQAVARAYCSKVGLGGGSFHVGGTRGRRSRCTSASSAARCWSGSAASTTTTTGRRTGSSTSASARPASWSGSRPTSR